MLVALVLGGLAVFGLLLILGALVLGGIFAHVAAREHQQREARLAAQRQAVEEEKSRLQRQLQRNVRLQGDLHKQLGATKLEAERAKLQAERAKLQAERVKVEAELERGQRTNPTQR